MSSLPTTAARRSLPSIGCILTNFDDSFGTRVLHGLLDASVGTANIVLSRTEGYHEREQQLIAQYEDLDGLILLPELVGLDPRRSFSWSMRSTRW